MSQSGPKTVAIIGAGVSGLSSIKTCLEEGMQVTCYERRGCVGGVWSEESFDEGPQMYSSLVTNTSKSMTCFSDFPCPAYYPPYIPYRLYYEYLNDYAKHFQLIQYIKFNSSVKSVKPSKNYKDSGSWIVKTEQTCIEYDGVIICAGFFGKAWIPKVPGIADFQGNVLHSRDYLHSGPFRNRTVLVIGNASSAVDIACDVSSVAKQVYLSVGNGCAVINRVSSSGLPTDLGLKRIAFKLLHPLKMLEKIQDLCNAKFNHKVSGLFYSGRTKSDCPITVSDDLPARIISGKVKTLPFVKSCKDSSITTEDGAVYEDIDDIIFATGYKRDLSMLSPSLKLDEEKLNLYKMSFPVDASHHTLAVVGCVRLVGPMPPVVELQSRLAAYVLSGRLTLPSREIMQKDADKFNQLALRGDGTYKYSFPSLYMSDDLADFIGVKPMFWNILLSGKIKLAFQCFLGPAFPFHYRLCEPGRWDGAEAAINAAKHENLSSLSPRGYVERKKNSRKLFVPLVICVMSCFLYIFYHTF